MQFIHAFKIWVQTPIDDFHFMMCYWWAWPNLWPNVSDNTQLMLESSGHMDGCPMVKNSTVIKAHSIQWLFLKIALRDRIDFLQNPRTLGYDSSNSASWSFHMGFPGGTSGKEPACQYRRCKRCRFNPWVRKLPWRTEWQPTPVFLPGESHGQRSLAGYSP